MYFTKARGKTIIHSRNLDSANTIGICNSKAKTLEKDIEAVAFSLRKEILQINKNPLPNKILLEDIYKGECDIPPLTRSFFTKLISGPFERRATSGTK